MARGASPPKGITPKRNQPEYIEKIASQNTDRFGQPLSKLGKENRTKARKIMRERALKKTSAAKRYQNQK